MELLFCTDNHQLFYFNFHLRICMKLSTLRPLNWLLEHRSYWKTQEKRRKEVMYKTALYSAATSARSISVHTFLCRAWNSLVFLITKCFLPLNRTSTLKSCKQKETCRHHIIHWNTKTFCFAIFLNRHIPEMRATIRKNPKYCINIRASVEENIR